MGIEFLLFIADFVYVDDWEGGEKSTIHIIFELLICFFFEEKKPTQ